MHANVLPAQELPPVDPTMYDEFLAPTPAETFEQNEPGRVERWMGNLATRYAAFAGEHPNFTTVMESGAAALVDRGLSAVGDRIGIGMADGSQPRVAPDEVPGVGTLKEVFGEGSRMARVVGGLGSLVLQRNAEGGRDLVLPSAEAALREARVSRSAGQALLAETVSFGVGAATEAVASRKRR